LLEVFVFVIITILLLSIKTEVFFLFYFYSSVCSFARKQFAEKHFETLTMMNLRLRFAHE